MALTNEQREEMRNCVVGPCANAEKQKIQGKLPLIGEVVEDDDLWEWTGCSFIMFDRHNEWTTTDTQVAGPPTISAKDFISKYLSDATK